MFVGFSFEWCGGHRDVLSFPTRRSSDLSREARGVREGRFEFGVTGWFLRGDSVMGSRGARGFARLVWGSDRKSTRLNSSHGSISYAVFCLKKKGAGIHQGGEIRLVLGVRSAGVGVRVDVCRFFV